MDNPEKLATQVTQDKEKKQKTKPKKNPTQCALDTTICKQTQITLIRHEPSYKQLEVKTNQPSFDNYAFVYLFSMIQNGYAYRFFDRSIWQKYHTSGLCNITLHAEIECKRNNDLFYSLNVNKKRLMYHFANIIKTLTSRSGYITSI
jgi:hypothetical protein